jgi:hypothetical protein
MKKILAGVGIIGLCGLCCALPPLFIGGAGVIGASIVSWEFGVITLLGISVLVLITRRRTNKATCKADGSCGCKPGVH